MLSDTLNTNEVKNAAGAEVEFERLSSVDRTKVFAQKGEAPARPHRLSVKHQETGTGLKLRRRSLVRVDKTVISDVDNETPVTISAYKVMDIPVGALSASTEIANVSAELDSFCATLGTSTVLYDGTGNGDAALIAGTL